MNRIYNIVVFAIILICSKQQYNVDLSSISKDPNYNDIIRCTQNEDLNTCTSVSMKGSLYQCCKAKTTTLTYYSYQDQYKPITISICSVWVAQQLSDKELEIAEKSYSETVAFFRYAYNIYIPLFKMEFTCKSKTYSFNYDIGSYTMKK